MTFHNWGYRWSDWADQKVEQGLLDMQTCESGLYPHLSVLIYLGRKYRVWLYSSLSKLSSHQKETEKGMASSSFDQSQWTDEEHRNHRRMTELFLAGMKTLNMKWLIVSLPLLVKILNPWCWEGESLGVILAKLCIKFQTVLSIGLRRTSISDGFNLPLEYVELLSYCKFARLNSILPSQANMLIYFLLFNHSNNY